MTQSPSCPCGAGALAREKLGLKQNSGERGSLAAKINRAIDLLRATLEEIFDESSYQRFLERSQLQSSSQAYALFQCENEKARARRPRCC
jgi:hypothetical protein